MTDIYLDLKREVDTRTGLAAVPEGHFWRVSRRASSRYPFEVKLYRHDPTWWNRNRVTRVRNADEIFAHGIDLQAATFDALMKLRKAIHTLESAQKETTIVGDYPPKVHPVNGKGVSQS